MICEVCGSKMHTIYKRMAKQENKQFYMCNKCHLLWAPFLKIDESFVSDLNEVEREKALGSSRKQEFSTILERMREIIPSGRDGLEVGCAYGWFLDAAKDKYNVIGIEAEDKIASYARNRGHKVLTGYFPDDLPISEYDFIIFNNVWEHINNTSKLIEACTRYTKPDGYVIFTILLSTGVIYKTAALLERVGRTKELIRLWQLHFHSPHVYYFNKENIVEIMLRYGFELVNYESVKSIDVNQMKSRFSMDKNEKKAGLKAFLFKFFYFFAKHMAEDKGTFYFRYKGKV